ncbi:Ribokinase-like protein [Rhizoclosmatium globosum]|uniref:Adenosine kinase n=1 Tax=Rhizoclosmatium globosum TaxID=329046 RepID=A0A1Y2C5Q2_9FUNG|nr:Ribokinase-like protein [Rhizoclosmatium globosum]|eukprot:ORY42368.1 Ribokinase-like protein [Rhizoclosmatium globosum]
MSSSTHPLVLLGQPLLDISVSVSNEELSQFGLKANDMVLASDCHAALFSAVETREDAWFLAGGSAQNSARGAQWLLPADSVAFVGCVGNDAAKETLERVAAKDGLTADFLVHQTLPTGKCAVLITGNNRSMVTDLQASQQLDLHKLKTRWERVENARIFYCTAYLLKDSFDAVLAVAQHATNNNKTFCFNLAAPWIPSVFPNELEQAIYYADYLFGNESEARAYAEANKLSATSIDGIALHMSTLPKSPTSFLKSRIVVITQGPDPIIIATNGQLLTHPVPKVSDIVDTNGAGDAFCGGFLAGLVEQRDLNECLEKAVFVANTVLKQQGASYPPKATSNI